MLFGLGPLELLVIGALLVLLLGPRASRRLFERGRRHWHDFRRLRRTVKNPLGALLDDSDDPPRS